METSSKPNFASSIESFIFLGLGFYFFFLPRENFLVSTFLLVSCVSWPSKEDTWPSKEDTWPSKEDIASHMALTQPHLLQINSELNTR